MIDGRSALEFGKPENLIRLISVVEHDHLSPDLREVQAMIIAEIIKNVILSEHTALFLLQKYGISKLLAACKKNRTKDNSHRMVMELTEKLVLAGKNSLSVNILFMLASNSGVAEIHPKL